MKYSPQPRAAASAAINSEYPAPRVASMATAMISIGTPKASRIPFHWAPVDGSNCIISPGLNLKASGVCSVTLSSSFLEPQNATIAHPSQWQSPETRTVNCSCSTLRTTPRRVVISAMVGRFDGSSVTEPRNNDGYLSQRFLQNYKKYLIIDSI